MNYYSEIVPYEIAGILYENGYREKDCDNWYNGCGVLLTGLPEDSEDIAAPTYGNAFGWLADKGVVANMYHVTKGWQGTIFCGGTIVWEDNAHYEWVFAAYETIKKAIEILKENEK